MDRAEVRPSNGRPRDLPRASTIAIGGLAGSLGTLRAIAKAFPGDFRGTMFIVAHIC
jgi:chemotaxis response regulator CheB